MNDTCGCCSGIHVAVPASEFNAPGLAALDYRVGTYATFLETMLARLSAVPGLTTRDPADPSIALIDAWATVADVLTFYQERIANEGYLPTACERRSVLELARLIGYRLRPGVSASVRLAFTVASGFFGTIPAGTRAQSVPGTGQRAQYYETSADFEARDAWNALAPRMVRPQVIAPAPAIAPSRIGGTVTTADVLPNAADVIQTIYADGIATAVRPGDALLFVFGSGENEQYLRLAQAVDAQGAFGRTEVTLAPDPLYAGNIVLEIYLAQAQYSFPGSDIAARVSGILTALLANVQQALPAATRVAVLRAAIPGIVAQRDLADARNFTRVFAFLNQLIRAIGTLVIDGATSSSNVGKPLIFVPLPAEQFGSPLARLDGIVGALAKPASLQPANALQLSRSVSQSFAVNSDIAPRMIAALRPAAATTLYQAWTALGSASSRLQLYAMRVKATLFASNYAGAATVTSGSTVTTSFAPPNIGTAWRTLSLTAPLASIALDAVYDRITVGSWVAIDRPTLDSSSNVIGRSTTVHAVSAVRASGMDTGTGFSAKASIVTLDPPWLYDDPGGSPLILKSESVLRDTVVYAQAEPLTLADEPLDTDIESGSIDLDSVYSGLEPGRWVVVSGNRTDVPGAGGVAASELAMLAGISQQGSPSTQPPLCMPFPFPSPPLAQYFYTTGADVNGDRLVVGQLDPVIDVSKLALPAVVNQQYCNQVELAAGVYANAYVPSAQERAGNFPSFEGMLIDPSTGEPFAGGAIDRSKRANVFAIRIADEKLHTVLDLATPLAYSYDRGSATIYGNVTDATHGQSVGEVLGNGDATHTFATFALGQDPLTYVSAPTASGVASTLNVRVNDLLWHEVGDFGEASPTQRAYVTGEDDAQETSVTFGDGTNGARLPTGTANVKATYRFGLGKVGNADARQIRQLAAQPLGVQSVVNPLPATGGADADTLDQARQNAPCAVMALDRLVSVRDYADFSRTYAGIGKAAATRISDGLRQVVHVTVAGGGDAPIDPSSDLYRNLVQSLQSYGDPHLPVVVDVRRVKLIVMSASVTLLADYAWESVASKVRDALLARFAFDARALGQTAFQSEATLAAQSVEGVAYINVTTFDAVAENVTAAQLTSLAQTLQLLPYVRAEAARLDPTAAAGSPGRFLAAELAFLTPDIPETLILTQANA